MFILTHVFSFLFGLDLCLCLFDALAEEDNLLDLALGLEGSTLQDASETLKDLSTITSSFFGDSLDEGMLESEIDEDVREIAEEDLRLESVLFRVSNLESVWTRERGMGQPLMSDDARVAF